MKLVAQGGQADTKGPKQVEVIGDRDDEGKSQHPRRGGFQHLKQPGRGPLRRDIQNIVPDRSPEQIGNRA